MLTDDEISLVQTRRQEFTEYFIDEFEGKLKWLTKILESKKEEGNLIKDLISAGSDALTGSPKSVIDLFGAKLVDYIEDKKNKKTADHLCSLAYEFKKEIKQKEIRKILVEGCMDIFQSFEMPFMLLSAKTGGEIRAMQKLAIQATHNVFEYYKIQREPKFTPEFIVKGVIFNFDKKLPSFSKTVRDDTIKLNTAKLFLKVGLVIEEDNKLNFYKSDYSKEFKYGYRRLLNTELQNKTEILSKYTRDQPNKDYEFVLKVCNIDFDAKEMLKYLNDRDPNLMEQRLTEKIGSVTKDIVQELSEGIIQDLLTCSSRMEEIIKDLMKKLDETKVEKRAAPKYQININDNKVGTWNNQNHFH